MPTKEQVRLIFKDTYNLYLKYISMSFIDWDAFHTEYTFLSEKYPFDLTISILEGIVQVIGKGKGGLWELIQLLVNQYT